MIRTFYLTARCVVTAMLVLACWPAGAADTSKRLRLAINDMDSLDPQQWQTASANDVGYGIFEALYDWDYLARVPDLVPRTASGMPAISAGGTVWTIGLQPKIFFTDHPAFGGKPRELTAQDYVYSIKRELDPNLRRGGSPIMANLIVGMRAVVDAARKPGAKFDYDAPVEGLHALDRYTLQLRLSAPNYSAMRNFLPGNVAIAREVVEALQGDIEAEPVGTGPYKLKEWRRGSRVVLEANSAYRVVAFPESSEPSRASLVREMRGKPLPQVGTIEFSVIEEMQPRVLEFERGNLDIAMLRGSGVQPFMRNGSLDPALEARGVRRDAYHYTTRTALFNMDDPIVGGFSKEHMPEFAYQHFAAEVPEACPDATAATPKRFRHRSDHPWLDSERMPRGIWRAWRDSQETERGSRDAAGRAPVGPWRSRGIPQSVRQNVDASQRPTAQLTPGCASIRQTHVGPSR